MRRDAERADRCDDVRAAARAWRRAGVIAEPTLDAILASYPDDRVRVSTAFRLLFFLFTLVAAIASFALLAVNEVPLGPLLFLSAFVCIGLTEVQLGPRRRSAAGAEEATALLGFGFALAALLWAFQENGGGYPWRLVCMSGALMAAAATWRWGHAVFGALSALCLFLGFADATSARLVWILLALVLAPPLVIASTARKLAPSQRRAADAALVVVLGALYLAVHLGSYDARFLERFFTLDGPTPGRLWFVAGTASLPLGILAAGVFLRRPLLLRMGLLASVASLVTLRFYVHVAPLWVVLLVSGGAALGLALGMHRWLAGGPRGERAGFTSRPLFGDPTRAGVLDFGLSAALTPQAPPGPTKPGFEGGGGGFGGGGATGSY